MRKVFLCLALVSLLALGGGQAVAELCTIDNVPAATLLLPYFEVDLSTDQGITTLFEINNASATDTIAHVVLWSDLSVPILDFNVYLTGYDVVPINMRDVVNGNLPQTGPGPGPHGSFSVADPGLDTASCAGQLPPPPLANFPGLVEAIQGACTGQDSIFGGCLGVDHGDDICRGYVTVDDVRTCTLQFQDDLGYFVGGGLGEATDENVLWGNYYYVDPSQASAQADTLVHVEAQPQAFAPGDYTFYGRYVSWTGADDREPTSTTFGARYLNNAAFTGGTDFIVWRDGKAVGAPFLCGTTPFPFPLGQESIVIFDEMENPDVPQVFPVSPQPPQTGITPFPYEAQRTTIGGAGSDLFTPFDSGWIYLNLNTTTDGVNPPADPAAAQAWVTTVMSAEGQFSVGMDALSLDSACMANHVNPGPP